MIADPVAYSPILHRPPLRWPGGARVALWIMPNIEHYEYLPATIRTRDPWPRPRIPTCWPMRSATIGTESDCDDCLNSLMP